MKLVFDIETNGLKPDTLWCLVAYDIDKEITYIGSDHDDDHLSVSDVLAVMDNATHLIGHNIIGYDLPWLTKLTGWEPKDQKIQDTWIMSMLNSYKRDHKHGLGAWGEKLGNSKIEFSDFDNYSKEMVRYCAQDCKVNADVYKHLVGEVQTILKNKPNYMQALQVEHDFARIESQIRMKGWRFDMEKAEEYLAAMDKEMEDIRQRIEPQLPVIQLKIDPEPKKVRYTQKGHYHSVTARHLSDLLGKTVYPADALADEPPYSEETYQRIEEVQANLGNLDSVKEFLFSIGWEPDDWNFKRISQYEFAKTTPKLTDTSLKKLGDVGADIGTYYSTRNRHSVLRGWIDEVSEGRLRGRMWTIGTPTFRVRHEVITNIPAVDSPWGKELRSLLIAEDGYKIVGADSAGNQMRGLCHYIADPEFTDTVINGDVHQRNADVLGCGRGVAKGFLYAFLFGAGDAKLGEVLTGTKNGPVGKDARAKFANSIPGMKTLKDKLDSIFHQTKARNNGNAFFPGLDGRRIYVESAHQALNYLLQAAEGVTMKAAMVYADKKLKAEGLDFYWTLYYHDEVAACVREEHAERCLEIFIEALTEAPKAYGVTCMTGDGTIGTSYADVH